MEINRYGGNEIDVYSFNIKVMEAKVHDGLSRHLNEENMS